jgi:hypothetical protein
MERSVEPNGSQVSRHATTRPFYRASTRVVEIAESTKMPSTSSFLLADHRDGRERPHHPGTTPNNAASTTAYGPITAPSDAISIKPSNPQLR